jgi:adenylate cyclase
MNIVTDARRTLRHGIRWLNRRRSLVSIVRGYRQLLPGDPDFGDPMSTVGTSPSRVLGRRAGSFNEGRLSILAELSLATLQVADWLEELRGVAASEELAILFADLRGYSQWALEAGDGTSADLLRNADALITGSVDACEGQVVKRLGDGTMAIFPDCAQAVNAAFHAISEVDELSSNGGFSPPLRAGVHVGTPQRIGDDFIGVDVNVAARLCEAAPGGQVLVSEEVRQRAGTDGFTTEPTECELRGVPSSLEIYRAKPR